MPHLRTPLLALALGVSLGSVVVAGDAARADFPLAKINFIDTSQAPKIRIWASVLKRRWKPPGDKDIGGITLYRKPDKGSAEMLFSIETSGEIGWPKTMSEDDKKLKEKAPPELALAAEVDQGSAIAVVVPGFQDPEYRNGTLGERSRNGAGLFFKKLGKTNLMNALWYTDFVFSYVYTEGRTNSLTRLETEREKCDKWDRDNIANWGLTPEELAAKEAEAGTAGATGPKKNEARCGLTKDYGELGKMVGKMSYDGFWPQLFGISQRICVKPEHEIKSTGFTGEGSEGGAKRLTAMDAALEMLVKDGTPSMPKILILTGDGRDGYINAASDCRQKYTVECQGRDEIKALTGKELREKVNACVQEQLEKDVRIEQASFVEKLPTWIGLAKAANIRIYSVTHPTAPPYARERLDVLAWRTGGTSRYAADANQVGDYYDDLITELNNQVVITFVDDEAKPNAELQYEVEVRGLLGDASSSATARSEPFKAVVPPAIEKSMISEFKTFGQAKLGKTGFLAALAGVGLLVLLLLFKLGKKLFSDGSAKAAKGAKGAAGKGNDAAAKAKAKAIEKAKKAKEAQKKAMEKAKKG